MPSTEGFDRSPLVSRRHLLMGGAAALGGATVAGLTHSDARANEPADIGAAVEPCWGQHQSGVATRLQSHAAFVGFHLANTTSLTGLRRLMTVWTTDIERLTQGHPALADPTPELAAPPAGLTITVGVGPGLWRIKGLPQRPRWLEPLPEFSIDRLQKRWRQPDLLVQLGADDPVTLAHARQVMVADAAAFATASWTQQGFHRAAGAVAAGTTGRNLMGYVDGTVNPTTGSSDFDRVVWLNDGPGWLNGGTGMVLRRIRMDLKLWSSIDRHSREQIMGRRMSDGAPLTGTAETDTPDLVATTTGGLLTIPEFAHVRIAHQATPEERIYRRPYNYDDPHTDSDPDAGLLFVAYAADLHRQYLPIQERLADQDLLNRWTIPIGSAVLAVLPGFQPGELLGQTLLT